MPHAAALGDDLDGSDDEDGVEFVDAWTPGYKAHITVTASSEGYLNGWADFNGDEDWIDLNEQIIKDIYLNTGGNNLEILIPDSIIVDTTFVRFRFSSVMGLSHTGYAPDGEVEDYKIEVKSTDVEDPERKNPIPKTYDLLQNYPNPFNPETIIEYYLPVTSKIKLSIFNIQGYLIKEWNIAAQSAGIYKIIWNSCDGNGLRVPTGIYIYRIEAKSINTHLESFKSVRKMILLK